jgi:hypothetical protein
MDHPVTPSRSNALRLVLIKEEDLMMMNHYLHGLLPSMLRSSIRLLLNVKKKVPLGMLKVATWFLQGTRPYSTEEYRTLKLTNFNNTGKIN